MGNLDNWIFLLLGLVLGIPLSIFANFATPWVKSYIDNRSLSIRERKIKILIKNYKYTKEHHEDKSLQIIFYLRTVILLIVFNAVFAGFLLLSLSIFQTEGISIMVMTGLGIALISFLFFYNVFNKEFLVASRVMREFNKYKEETLKKLKKLGYEGDLDKEESEG